MHKFDLVLRWHPLCSKKLTNYLYQSIGMIRFGKKTRSYSRFKRGYPADHPIKGEPGFQGNERTGGRLCQLK